MDASEFTRLVLLNLGIYDENDIELFNSLTTTESIHVVNLLDQNFSFNACQLSNIPSCCYTSAAA